MRKWDDIELWGPTYTSPNMQPSPSPCDSPPLLSLEDVKGEHGNTGSVSYPPPPKLVRQNGYVHTLPTIQEEAKNVTQPKRGRKRPYRQVNPYGRDRRLEGDMTDDYKVDYCSFDKRSYRNETKEVEMNIRRNEMDEAAYELCRRPGILGF